MVTALPAARAVCNKRRWANFSFDAAGDAAVAASTAAVYCPNISAGHVTRICAAKRLRHSGTRVCLPLPLALRCRCACARGWCAGAGGSCPRFRLLHGTASAAVGAVAWAKRRGVRLAEKRLRAAGVPAARQGQRACAAVTRRLQHRTLSLLLCSALPASLTARISLLPHSPLYFLPRIASTTGMA